jgi:glutamate-1-semialdehyde 2,1-aminomutase
MNIEKSQALFERSKKVAPGGVHSPVRAFLSVGGSPIFFKKGEGAKLTDEDGNVYTDYCMSWGALALGHAHPKVIPAIQAQVTLGTHYGTPTKLDVTLAEMALEFIRPFEKIRFVNSGTEAVMTAIRLARGLTLKDKIVKIDGAYHGHVDSLLVNAGSGLVTQGQSSSIGVTKALVQDTLVVPYNNIEALEIAFKEYGSEIAAIILEPILANSGLFEFDQKYLERCRQLCDEHCALLIFDEVITGFRVGPGGSMQKYNMKPDIATYGKILGGGMPMGAIASTAKLLDGLAPIGKVYQAGTLSGNPVTMTAGIAGLQVMKDDKFYDHVERLGKVLDSELEKIKATARVPFSYRRIGSIFWIVPGTTEIPKGPNDIPKVAAETYRKIYHELLAKGVYLSPSVYEVAFISLAHTEEDMKYLAKCIGEL